MLPSKTLIPSIVRLLSKGSRPNDVFYQDIIPSWPPTSRLPTQLTKPPPADTAARSPLEAHKGMTRIVNKEAFDTALNKRRSTSERSLTYRLFRFDRTMSHPSTATSRNNRWCCLGSRTRLSRYHARRKKALATRCHVIATSHGRMSGFDMGAPSSAF